MADNSSMWYPMNMIADAYERVAEGMKRVDFSDDGYKISVYSMGNNTIRIDIQEIKQ